MNQSLSVDEFTPTCGGRGQQRGRRPSASRVTLSHGRYTIYVMVDYIQHICMFSPVMSSFSVIYYKRRANFRKGM